MLKVLLIVAVVMLTIYCVVELAQTKGARVRRPRQLGPDDDEDFLRGLR